MYNQVLKKYNFHILIIDDDQKIRLLLKQFLENNSFIVTDAENTDEAKKIQELIKKAGIERRVHTAGRNKSTLDPFLEEKKEDVERLKKIQLELHSDFIKVVEESRSSKIKKEGNPDLFTGEFWSGSTSLKLGLIDGIGNAEQILREKFGEEVVIKKFEKSKSFIAKKLSASIDNQVDNIANILEERAEWQKFGL